MVFCDLPDAVHSTDVAIAYEFTESLPRERRLISAEKSEYEIICHSHIVDAQAREVEQRCLDREKSELHTIDLTDQTSIVENSIHIFVSGFFSTLEGAEVILVLPYSYTFLCISGIEDESLWGRIVSEMILSTLLMGDDGTTRRVDFYQEGNDLPVESIEILLFSCFPLSLSFRGTRKLLRISLSEQILPMSV